MFMCNALFKPVQKPRLGQQLSVSSRNTDNIPLSKNIQIPTLVKKKQKKKLFIKLIVSSIILIQVIHVLIVPVKILDIHTYGYTALPPHSCSCHETLSMRHCNSMIGSY